MLFRATLTQTTNCEACILKKMKKIVQSIGWSRVVKWHSAQAKADTDIYEYDAIRTTCSAKKKNSLPDRHVKYGHFSNRHDTNSTEKKKKTLWKSGKNDGIRDVMNKSARFTRKNRNSQRNPKNQRRHVLLDLLRFEITLSNCPWSKYKTYFSYYCFVIFLGPTKLCTSPHSPPL